MKPLTISILLLGVVCTLQALVAAQIASNLNFEQVAVLPIQGTPAFAPMNDSRAYFYNGALTKTNFLADLATGKISSQPVGLFLLEGSCAAIGLDGTIYVIGGDQLGDGSGSATFQYLAPGDTAFTASSGMYQTRQYHRCVADHTWYWLGFNPGSNPKCRRWIRSSFGQVHQNVYIMGGTDENNLATDYIQIFNSTTELFSQLGVLLATPHSNMGTVYVPELNLIILCGGDEAKCQYVQPPIEGNTPQTGVITTNLQPSNATYAHVNGPNLYLVQKSGQILVSKCALPLLCPNGCIDGVCADAPTPVAVAPFSGCAQCSGDTPLCIAERGVCVGNRVVPILQCIDTLDNGKKRSHFSYNNGAANTVNIDSNSATNFIVPSGTPAASFTPGREFYYPLDAFTVDSTPSTMAEWFVDGYSLRFNTSDATLACPSMTPITSDQQVFLNKLTQAITTVLGISSSRVHAEFVGQKRQSNLEAEIEVTVTPSQDLNEPSAADVVSNFVTNQTIVQKVQEQVPEVQSVIPLKPLSTEVNGKAIVPGVPTTPTAPVAPKVPITASSSVKITERIFLPMNVLWICMFSVLYVWIQFG